MAFDVPPFEHMREAMWASSEERHAKGLTKQATMMSPDIEDPFLREVRCELNGQIFLHANKMNPPDEKLRMSS